MAPDSAKNQSLAVRIRWLFTRDGFPVLLSIVVGLVLGFFLNGVVGLILATLAGFVVLWLFRRFPFRLRPWQALVIDIMPTVAKLFFSMAFLLPFADYMTLPTGHTPDTLPKYLSIVVALPKNLFSSPRSDIYPGFVFIVIIAILLMYRGSMNLEKIKFWLLATGGLLLYTLSPTITSTLLGSPKLQLLGAFFGVGYYSAWLGLVLLLVARFLPRFLRVPEPQSGLTPTLAGVLPPVLFFGALAHMTFHGGGHLSGMPMFDFEETHHLFAGAFSGGVAGASSAIIVGQAYRQAEGIAEEDRIGEGDENNGQIGPPPEEPPDVPDQPPLPQGPFASTDPEDPVGTTIQYNPDGTMVKRLPDGTTGTRYSDGTEYVEGPNGERGTYYPDGTSKEWTPESGLEVKHPNGDRELTVPAGRTGGITNNQDGSIDITSPYGGKLHCPREGEPAGSLTTHDGDVITFPGDGSATYTTLGGKLTMDKDGNFSGSMTDGQGNRVTIKTDGSIDAETAEGDKITIDADGMKAKFKDGSFLNTDASGKPVSAHLKNDDGSTIDINTDDKGGLHIKDDQGNSADINQDGSGQMKDSDGNVATQDKDGNASMTNKEGTKWVAKNDGTGCVQDNKGNRIDLHSDGSVTATNAAGKQVTYTPDQLRQMQAQTGSAPTADGG